MCVKLPKANPLLCMLTLKLILTLFLKEKKLPKPGIKNREQNLLLGKHLPVASPFAHGYNKQTLCFLPRTPWRGFCVHRMRVPSSDTSHLTQELLRFQWHLSSLPLSSSLLLLPSPLPPPSLSLFTYETNGTLLCRNENNIGVSQDSPIRFKTSGVCVPAVDSSSLSFSLPVGTLGLLPSSTSSPQELELKHSLALSFSFDCFIQ